MYSLPSAPTVGYFDLGEEEFRLRDAVRSAADALSRLRAEPGSDIDDPREMVRQLLVETQLHRLPDHAPTRAVRVLETAAHIDAIIAEWPIRHVTIVARRPERAQALLDYARAQHPDLSLEELGQTLTPPVGKSGVNHRMRRLTQFMREELPEESAPET